jgi:hypothetical protein
MRKSRAKTTNDIAPEIAVIDRAAIEKLAYHYWVERGCPEGSPGEDWLRAERVIQAKQSHPALVEAVMKAAS